MEDCSLCIHKAQMGILPASLILVLLSLYKSIGALESKIRADSVKSAQLAQLSRLHSTIRILCM